MTERRKGESRQSTYRYECCGIRWDVSSGHSTAEREVLCQCPKCGDVGKRVRRNRSRGPR